MSKNTFAVEVTFVVSLNKKHASSEVLSFKKFIYEEKYGIFPKNMEYSHKIKEFKKAFSKVKCFAKI